MKTLGFAMAKQDDIIKWLLDEIHHGQRRTHNNLEAMQVKSVFEDMSRTEFMVFRFGMNSTE